MHPNLQQLLQITGINTPVIGLYDTPDPTPFVPWASPHHCIFACFEDWTQGASIKLKPQEFSCMGVGYWLCGTESLPREQFLKFLVDQEGLKASEQIMAEWLEQHPPYQPKHQHIVIGPLQPSQEPYLKTVTFYLTPDQLSFLLTACEYHNAQPTLVSAPFGSGCGQLCALFTNLQAPQAIIGATDIAMRRYLPPHLLALTVTKPMFDQICHLPKNSFCYKSFWRRLQKARDSN